MDATVDSSPLKRLCTFLLGLATFALFGVLGVIAHKATGGGDDPAYKARAQERVGLRKAALAAQAEKMKSAPVDFAVSVGSLSAKKVTVSTKPVPGTKAFDEWMATQAAAAAAAAPAPAAPAEVVQLKLESLPGGVMKYKQTELTVKAGSQVELTFINSDILQHNFLLLEQGTMQKVGAAADAGLADPNFMKNGFIPQDPEIKKLILAHSKMLNAAQVEVIKFTAPTAPGDYPYICTFPGHWRLMFGNLKVTP